MGDTGNGFSLQDLIGALTRMGGGSDPARTAGVKAVEGAVAPGRVEPTVSGETAHAAGTSAVDREMDKANTEAWRDKMQARKGEVARAGQEGKAAVADATRPAAIRDLINALMQQAGWTSPEESAAWARGLGESAVGQAVLPTPTQPMPMTAPGAPQLADPERARFQGTGAVAEELGLPRELRRPSTPVE
jgi:hypothetical protein